MSLFAGVYSLDDHVQPDPDAVEAISRLISRRDDGIETYSDQRFFIAKLDFDAFGDRAFLADRTITAVTGEPFLDPDSSPSSGRAQDVRKIAAELSAGDLSVFRRCQGSFSVCHYDPVGRTLTLATDRIGVRPVYVSIGGTAVFFSSNLRVLEGIAAIPKRADLRGITETVALGYPLGDRTPYADIRVLRGGEAMQWKGRTQRSVTYFRWCEIPERSLTSDQMLDAVYETFMAAVACRSARAEEANAFLSGGLDSRAIVAGLCALGKTVHTLTYEIPGTKDGLFSRRIAEHLGIHHNPRPFDSSMSQRLHQASSAGQICYPSGSPVAFPRLIFSGDGGSYSLGFTDLTEGIAEAMRRGDPASVAYRRAGYLPERLFRRDAWKRAENIVAEGLLAELERPGTRDPAWDANACGMDNGDRRHLHLLFEDLDLLKMEFLLPFHDGRFHELVVSGQFEWFLYHRFYNDRLRRFPGAIDSIPWQSYRNHAPCPLPEASGGYRQGSSKAERAANAAPQYRRCRALLLQKSYPSPVLRRLPMAAALLMHGCGIDNYQSVFKTCIGYHTWLARSEGPPIWM